MQPELAECGTRTGQMALTGPLLALERRLDALFLRLAERWKAIEYAFPPFLPAGDLARIDYFRSFPHLATFPVALEAEEENLARFAQNGCHEGTIHLERAAPIRNVLSPAACYHVYGELEGEVLEEPRFVTTRGTCFRHEETYAPLQRQWAFSMREVVCLGTAGDVRSFLADAREQVTALCRRLGLEVGWEAATDPFFRPRDSAKYVLQKLEPIKQELVFDGLAIGSVNFHQDTFGEAFGLRAADAAAFSGCLAFGVERWLHTFLASFGSDPDTWPDLEAIDGFRD